MGLLPQVVRDRRRIDARNLPPGNFVAVAMELTMVAATEWDGELVADFAAERPALRESQVMSIAGLPATDQAGLLGDKPQVVAIADAARLGEGKYRLVDAARSCGLWAR
jgi:hypothetical protein